MIFIYYPKCSTCIKAKKWLDENGIKYTERHIVEDNPSYDELKEWLNKSGLPLKRFFNTSGLLYKEMQLKDKFPIMSEEERLKLLATNGMLVIFCTRHFHCLLNEILKKENNMNKAKNNIVMQIDDTVIEADWKNNAAVKELKEELKKVI